MISLTTNPASTPWPSSLRRLGLNHLCSVTKEALSIAGLCLFSSRHELSVSTVPLSWAIAGVSTTLIIFSYIDFISCKLPGDTISELSGETRLHSEPVFFRCKTHHTRLLPKRHSLAYSVLQCGIPLRFQGSVGRLFSFNNGHDDNRRIDNKWSLFGVDSRDYLRRGSGTFEDKMRAFLGENDMNLEDFPTVYLVTAPRFLGYQFNPVSFWYLKDKDSILSVVILEVNNTFDERHMYLCRPSNSQMNSTSLPQGARQAFSQSFPKVFHVSPFNNRTGQYHVHTRDPLSSREDSAGVIDTTITLYDDFENKKLIAALRTVAPPIFMSDLSTSILASSIFVVRYGWSGLITFPRIVWEASKLFGVKRLKVYLRPEVRTKTISRNATALEIQLEKYFRLYLRTRVQEHPYPIRVNYNAAGIGSLPQKETFQSTPATKTVVDIKVFDINILSPRFYVTWAASQSMQTLLSRMTSRPEERRLVESSDLQLIGWLLDNMERSGRLRSDRNYPSRGLTWYLIGWMRKWGFPSCGIYPMGSPPGTEREETIAFGYYSTKDHRIVGLPGVDSRVYGRSVLQATLTETIGFGDGKLIQAYDLGIRGTLVYLSWCGFFEATPLKALYAIGGLMAFRIFKGIL